MKLEIIVGCDCPWPGDAPPSGAAVAAAEAGVPISYDDIPPDKGAGSRQLAHLYL